RPHARDPVGAATTPPRRRPAPASATLRPGPEPRAPGPLRGTHRPRHGPRGLLWAAPQPPEDRSGAAAAPDGGDPRRPGPPAPVGQGPAAAEREDLLGRVPARGAVQDEPRDLAREGG